MQRGEIEKMTIWSDIGRDQRRNQSWEGDAAPMMAEMNLTPLIDVLLVLIVTLMMLHAYPSHSVNMNLCQDGGASPVTCHYLGPESLPPRPAPGDILDIAIDFDGLVTLNGVAVNHASLDQALIVAGNQQPESQPEVYFNPHALVEYKYVIAVLAMAQRDGVAKLSLPEGRGAFRRPEPPHPVYFADLLCGHEDEHRYLSWLGDIVANPFGHEYFFAGGPGRYVVITVVVWLLLLMGTASYLVLALKVWGQWHMARLFRRENTAQWERDFMQTGFDHLHRQSPLRQLADAAGTAAACHGDGNLRRHLSHDQWIADAVSRRQSAIQHGMQRGMGLLASVGATAPLIGFSGTVYGIVQALTLAGWYGSADIWRLIGPIGEALLTTGLGLLVALPAVVGFNLLAGAQARRMVELRECAIVVRMAMLESASHRHCRSESHTI